MPQRPQSTSACSFFRQHDLLEAACLKNIGWDCPVVLGPLVMWADAEENIITDHVCKHGVKKDGYCRRSAKCCKAACKRQELKEHQGKREEHSQDD